MRLPKNVEQPLANRYAIAVSNFSQSGYNEYIKLDALSELRKVLENSKLTTMSTNNMSASLHKNHLSLVGGGWSSGLFILESNDAYSRADNNESAPTTNEIGWDIQEIENSAPSTEGATADATTTAAATEKEPTGNGGATPPEDASAAANPGEESAL